MDLSFYIMRDTAENIYSLKIFSLLEYSNKYSATFWQGGYFLFVKYREIIWICQKVIKSF